MIEIERHIEILLLSNDCVIVPGLGGFMAHHVDARYDEGDGMFVPPLRTLGFNPQLTMNDSLLVQSYIETYDISYPEALRRIEAEVTEIRQHLETEGYFELNDIGVLSLNEEGKLEFEPCEAGILTPDLYGLGAFDMKPLAKPHELTLSGGAGKASEKHGERAIVIKMSWLRNVAVVAAAVIAFFMVGTPVKNSYFNSNGVQQSSFIPLPSTPTAAAHEDDSLAEEPVASTQESTEEGVVADNQELTTDSQQPTADSQQPTANSQQPTANSQQPTANSQQLTAKSQQPYFCIVLASQVSKHNAESFLSMLEEKGFKEGTIMMTKFRRVVYGSYPTEEEAVQQLRELRKQSSFFKEGWVMKIDN